MTARYDTPSRSPSFGCLSGRSDAVVAYRVLMSGDELQTLRAENARLRAVLEHHGIALPAHAPVSLGPGARDRTISHPAKTDGTGVDRSDPPCSTTSEAHPPTGLPSVLSPGDKVDLFRTRFAGREDVYALRWESTTTNRSGYAPARVPPWQL